MANNPTVNKVVYGGNTLIDLTEDTATVSDVAQGKTFHLASGAQATGSATMGASNIITGTITTPSESGESEITIPYTGSGYPIAMMFFPTGGLDSISPSSARISAGCLLYKEDTSTAPTYTGSASDVNKVVSAHVQLNGSSLTGSGGRSKYAYAQSVPSGNASMPAVAFKSATVFAYKCGTGSVLATDTEYTYVIVYSS